MHPVSGLEMGTDGPGKTSRPKKSSFSTSPNVPQSKTTLLTENASTSCLKAKEMVAGKMAGSSEKLEIFIYAVREHRHIFVAYMEVEIAQLGGSISGPAK